MSEKIKISVVIDDEKPNDEKRGKKTASLLLTQDSSVTLMPVLLQNHLMNGSFCGGRGDCGRCIVQFLEGAPLPTGIERARLTPEELRQGYRLACLTRPKTDCTVRIVESGDAEIPIVTEMNLLSENIDQNSRQNKLSENQKPDAMELDALQAGDGEKQEIENDCYIIAVDLGTTTIVMQLRELHTGKAAATYCEMNPQRVYGTDVLSRIEASCNGNREELQRLVCEVLARGLRQFAIHLQESRIACMCIAGNTTMEHLLMGYDVSSLGKAPFTPVETGLQIVLASTVLAGERAVVQDVLKQDFPVYIAPCISAFVGGDIVAGLYALGMLPRDSWREKTEEAVGSDVTQGKQEEKIQTTLLIDLGTNGEMAITDGRRMIVTATAAGPAFEGNGELIGTDRIALTAALLRQGQVDETGLLAEPYFEEGVPLEIEKGDVPAGSIRLAKDVRAAVEEKKNKCYFRKEDIRALQMAKAAIRAGVEILWEEMGCPEIDTVYLAGGFGYYLDVEAAAAIGLLPSHMRGRVRAVGNTSLEGAYLLGRDLVAEMPGEEASGKVPAAFENGSLQSLNLAKQENFERLYLKYLNLERN